MLFIFIKASKRAYLNWMNEWTNERMHLFFWFYLSEGIEKKICLVIFFKQVAFHFLSGNGKQFWGGFWGTPPQRLTSQSLFFFLSTNYARVKHGLLHRGHWLGLGNDESIELQKHRHSRSEFETPSPPSALHYRWKTIPKLMMPKTWYDLRNLPFTLYI